MKLRERVALITGGGSGIGREMARAFATEGARVVVTDLREETARETLDGLEGEGHSAFGGDVADAASVAETFREVGELYGRLDVLVNNAGVDHTPGDARERLLERGVQITHMTDDAWTRMLAIHLNGAFFCARAAAGLMLPARSGSIINLSSIAGLAGMGPIHYATAKGGVLGFTRSLARELGRFGIRVNAICPGAIDTPMTQGVPNVALKGMLAATPLGRLGHASEIASTALFLACDDSSFITGQAISPNGGVHIA